MFRETIKERVDNNRCPVCKVEFTKEYLRENDISIMFYTDLRQKVKMCKKHNFCEGNEKQAI